MDLTLQQTSQVMQKRLALTASLYVVTILPVLYYLSVEYWPEVQADFTQFVFLIGVLGVTHVGMTTYFYVGDRRYSEIIKGDKARYYVLPAGAIGLAFLVFLTSQPQVMFVYFMLHYAWLLWHFNKQNWGLLSMFNSSDRLQPLSRGEHLAFHAMPFGPIVYTMTIYPQMAEDTAGMALALKVTGVAIFAASALALLYCSFVEKRFRAPITTGWILLSVIFFLPAVLANNPAVALAFFAHPLQYIVMMVFLAGFGNEASKSAPLVRVGALFTFGLTIWALLWFLNNPISQYSLGAKIGLAMTYGITQWHFIADTGLWKLRNPQVRKNFVDSFGFMFGR